MPRALASLTLSFGLVSIPVRLYNATEPAPGVRFRLLAPDGTRIRQQYVADAPPPIADEEEAPAATAADVPAWADAGAPTEPSARAVPLRREAAVDARAAAAANAHSTAAAFPAPTAAIPSPAVATSSPAVAAPSPAAAAAIGRPGSQAALMASLVASRRAEAESTSAEDEADEAPAPRAAPAVARDRLLKGYEFEKGRFVTFTADELAALGSARRDTIDIVSFVPEHGVDPLYYEKPYFLAPERRGAKPYALLLEALRQSRRTAIAKWAWRGKEAVVEIRPTEGGLVLQQLRYAEEVRSIEALHIDLEPVGRAELALALQLVEHHAEPRFDPTRYENEERARIRAAIERKIAGRRIVEPAPAPTGGAQVIDLMEALRASLRRGLEGGAAGRNEASAEAREDDRAPTAARVDLAPAASRDELAAEARGARGTSARKPARRASPAPAPAPKTSADAPAPGTRPGAVKRGTRG